MKKKISKGISLFLAGLTAASLVAGAVTTCSHAAAKSPVVPKSISLKEGETKKISVAGNGWKITGIKAQSKKTAIAKVKLKKQKIFVTGIKAGKTTIVSVITAKKSSKTKTFKRKTSITVKKVVPADTGYQPAKTDLTIPDEIQTIRNTVDMKKAELQKPKKSLTCSDTLIIGETYTGTAYYISNGGNDNQDGLSPKTPKATIQSVFDDLKYGDALFLECGSEWYVPWTKTVDFNQWDNLKDALFLPEGVSIASYGEGKQPRIRGDMKQEYVMDTSAWQLYDDGDGKKIWCYTNEIEFPSTVAFNDGTKWARRADSLITAEGKFVNYDGSDYVIKDKLSDDMMYTYLPDTSRMSDWKSDGTFTESFGVLGKLYIRCDQGNPADVFRSIEISQVNIGFYIRTIGAICNIDISYFNDCGISADSYGRTTWDEEQNKVIRGCTIGFCGGESKFARDTGQGNPEYDKFGVMHAGGAIQASGNGITAEENYIHDCGPFAVIIGLHYYSTEIGGTTDFKHIHIKNNYFENSGSLHVGPYAEGEGGVTRLTDLQYDGNVHVNSGQGKVSDFLKNALEDVNTVEGTYYGKLSPVENFHGAFTAKDALITNNIFYLAAEALVCLSTCDSKGNELKTNFDFEGNISALRKLITELKPDGLAYFDSKVRYAEEECNEVPQYTTVNTLNYYAAVSLGADYYNHTGHSLPLDCWEYEMLMENQVFKDCAFNYARNTPLVTTMFTVGDDRTAAQFWNQNHEPMFSGRTVIPLADDSGTMIPATTKLSAGTARNALLRLYESVILPER